MFTFGDQEYSVARDFDDENRLARGSPAELDALARRRQFPGRGSGGPKSVDAALSWAVIR
jgi:hypothetical protein